jgi:hypothetical protein
MKRDRVTTYRKQADDRSKRPWKISEGIGGALIEQYPSNVAGRMAGMMIQKREEKKKQVK